MTESITGHHLKMARILYGYDTQEKLAKEMGVSVATVQRYETSHEPVDIKVLGQYLYTMNFDIDRIVYLVHSLREDRQQKLTIKAG